MNIRLSELKTNRFPDGMIQLIPPENIDCDRADIYGSITSFDELMILSQLIQVLKKKGLSNINLTIHYLIGSRMDRPNIAGYPNILRTVCDVINSFGVNVRVVWPHSSSTIDLLNANHLIEVEKNFLHRGIQTALEWFGDKEFDLCLPDSGAVKRYYNDHSPLMFNYRVLECGKRRDVKSGAILDFMVPCSPSTTCIIVDDLCDGGGTFVGLAKKLREMGAKRIGLVVYHGVMSKGKELEGIDFIFTTNSFADFNETDTFRIKKVV